VLAAWTRVGAVMWRRRRRCCPRVPCTTLFRSLVARGGAGARGDARRYPPCRAHGAVVRRLVRERAPRARAGACAALAGAGALRRSEEHTSELQSRENLVCRLLLEKKKLEKYRE